MFDFNKLGDISKLASDARQIQEKQERSQREQTELLRKILEKLDTVIELLKKS